MDNLFKKTVRVASIVFGIILAATAIIFFVVAVFSDVSTFIDTQADKESREQQVISMNSINYATDGEFINETNTRVNYNDLNQDDTYMKDIKLNTMYTAGDDIELGEYNIFIGYTGYGDMLYRNLTLEEGDTIIIENSDLVVKTSDGNINITIPGEVIDNTSGGTITLVKADNPPSLSIGYWLLELDYASDISLDKTNSTVKIDIYNSNDELKETYNISLNSNIMIELEDGDYIKTNSQHSRIVNIYMYRQTKEEFLEWDKLRDSEKNPDEYEYEHE